MYCKASGRTGGYLQSTNENVLAAGVPVELIYTGVHWKIDITRPNAENIYGTVAVDNGGTGRETLTSGYYLVGNGTGAVQLKSKSAVLSDIGAASKTELEQVKSSVSEGKALIASAVTDKGVTTAGDATFAKIAENIGLIMGGELSGGAEYPELTNEGTSADLRKDKELINDDGEVVVGTMETFDGSYECSDESTGGGGGTEAWTGTVYGQSGLGDLPDTSVCYIDETLSFRQITIPPREGATITIAAHTFISKCSISEFSQVNGSYIETMQRFANVVLPTADGFTVS